MFRQQICACEGVKGSKRVCFALETQEQAPVLIDQGEGPLDDIPTSSPGDLRRSSSVSLVNCRCGIQIFDPHDIPITSSTLRASHSASMLRRVKSLRRRLKRCKVGHLRCRRWPVQRSCPLLLLVMRLHNTHGGYGMTLCAFDACRGSSAFVPQRRWSHVVRLQYRCFQVLPKSRRSSAPSTGG